MDAFIWTGQSEDAAQLLADGRLTQQEIAGRIGVDRKTLWNWRQHPEFAARVEEHLAAFRDEVRRRGLAMRERRVGALNDRWNRMQRVLEARADDKELQEVPGGTTGLVVKDVKGVGKGENFQLIDIYRVDTALLKELREHEKQAAQELGQWVEKQHIEQTAKAYITVGPDDL